MNQRTNEDALLIIQAMTDEIAARADLLQGHADESLDDGQVHSDDYVPHMHNGERDGYLYPGLDRRWLAIGITDLQKGLLSLRKACEGGF